MGPTVLFDKSFLQSLSIDESVWFDHFFLTNISPLFFVETLADLEKSIRNGKTPEAEVGKIANKTPEMSASPNVFHMDILISNLLGQEIPMDGRIILTGGMPLKTADKTGVLFKCAPEMEALQRWRKGDFLEVERQFAKKWRHIIKGLSPDKSIKLLNSLGIDYHHCNSLEIAKDIANTFVSNISSFSDYSDLLIQMFNLSSRIIPDLFDRWLNAADVSLISFAPYATHMLTLELFYSIALATNQISHQLHKNRIDLAYLFYLPFCMLFVSSDHFHRRCAPLFVRDNQEFIWGEELKKDLGRINLHFDSVPDEDKQKGIYSIAARPPTEGDFLVARIWDRFFPNWRKRDLSFAPMKDSGLIQEIENFGKATASKESQLDREFLNPDAMIVERRIRKKKGRWWLVPKDIEDEKR